MKTKLTNIHIYRLFRIAYSSRLTDHRDLYLSWISHLILDLLCYLCGKTLSLLVVDLVSPHNYAQLTTRLDRIGLNHTGIR